MKLRTRLLAAMLLSALLPLGGVAWFLRPVLVHYVDRAHQSCEEVSVPSGTSRVSEVRVLEARAARERARQEAQDDLQALFVLAVVFATSTAVLLALVLSPAVTGPIRMVADAVGKVSLGTVSVQLDTTAYGEAGQLIKAYNRMARELEGAERRLRKAERLAAWRDIARQMAHEIKNPLTPIQMAVEMLRKARERQLPDFDELFDEQTRIVLEEVARLRRLVENFSRFARAPKPRPEALRLGEVVAHVVGLHAAGPAEVTGEVDGNVPELRADREQLTQVLVNLVANAKLAAEERAEKRPTEGPAAVHVSASNAPNGQVRIAVEDNGAGIDPAVLDRLFEPYVTTRQGRGGTGLGLAIAYRIVTEHGGTITAESSPQGTTFEIVLPLQGPPSTEATLDGTLDTIQKQ